jgi:hypothetical protein
MLQRELKCVCVWGGGGGGGVALAFVKNGALALLIKGILLLTEDFP